MKKNKVTLILDSSGSMSNIRQQTISMANEIVNTIKRDSLKHRQRTEFSLVTFDDTVNRSTTYTNVDIKKIKVLAGCDYVIGGMTALHDAIGTVLDDYILTHEYKDENCSFLVIVITDGYENASRKYKTYVKELIAKVNKTGRFTVTVQTPSGGEVAIQQLGIAKDNITSFSASPRGVKIAAQHTNSGVSQYYKSRAGGQSCTTSFYAQTDAKNISKTTLKTKLNDISGLFDRYAVNTRGGDSVKEVVSFLRPTKPYKLGEAYYELTKKETIQATKELVIMDKTGKLYGGDEARSLLNLPKNASAKVTPGQHGDYTIFVQSTSVNRKLLPGTKLLLRK